MNVTKHILITFLAAGLLAAPAAFAQPADTDTGKSERREQWKKRMDEKRAKFAEELGLTDEQRAKMKAHRESMKEQHKDGWEEIKSLREELKAELGKADFDKSKVRSLHNKIQRLKADSADRRLESMIELREILTQEQFTKMQDMRDKYREKRKGKWKKYHRMGEE